jgi:hypothetical protein
MPEISADTVPQIQVRDVLALLFAVLCGLMLGIAAAPSILPKLGFAVSTPYVEVHTRAERAQVRTAAAPPAAVPAPAQHPAQARVLPTQAPRPQEHGTRLSLKHAASTRLARLLAFRRSEANQAQPPFSLPTLSTIPLQTLFALGIFLFLLVLWLRRDMFVGLLCRLAKDPRQWRGAPSSALVNARCVLYLEGNTYRLGSEFFAQAVEVRYSPLFIRVNMKGSKHAIIVPRRMPKQIARSKPPTDTAAAG